MPTLDELQAFYEENSSLVDSYNRVLYTSEVWDVIHPEIHALTIELNSNDVMSAFAALVAMGRTSEASREAVIAAVVRQRLDDDTPKPESYAHFDAQAEL